MTLRLKDNINNFRISKQDVVDIFYLAYKELGIKNFVECIIKESLGQKYFNLLKTISNDNFLQRTNQWENFKEINDSNIKYLKSSMYSLIKNNRLLSELKRV